MGIGRVVQANIIGNMVVGIPERERSLMSKLVKSIHG